MKNLLIINTSINSGSTGRIAEEIGRTAIANDFNVCAGYGFVNNKSQLKTVTIGNRFDHYLHAIQTRVFDNHGCASKKTDKKIY